MVVDEWVWPPLKGRNHPNEMEIIPWDQIKLSEREAPKSPEPELIKGINMALNKSPGTHLLRYNYGSKDWVQCLLLTRHPRLHPAKDEEDENKKQNKTSIQIAKKNVLRNTLNKMHRLPVNLRNNCLCSQVFTQIPQWASAQSAVETSLLPPPTTTSPVHYSPQSSKLCPS